MQLLHENATMRFDDCRVARSIDKKSLDKILMLNLRSLFAKSNFLKKLLKRPLSINITIYIEHILHNDFNVDDNDV